MVVTLTMITDLPFGDLISLELRRETKESNENDTDAIPRDYRAADNESLQGK